eukprot:gene2754-4162_t
MSIYHFSETTFLNINHLSKNCSLTIETEEKFTPEDYDIIYFRSQFNPKNLRQLSGKSIFQNCTFSNGNGEIQILQERIFKTSFFSPPNGALKYQGWIKHQNQILSENELKGDVHLFVELFEKLKKDIKRISVNIEVNSDSIFLRDLLINVYRPLNRRFLENEPFFKEKFLLTETFQNLLLNTDRNGYFTYKPTMDQLFDDFLVKQLSEIVFKNSKVWNQSSEVLMDILFHTEFDLPDYAIDITPILLFFKKDSKLTEKISEKISIGNFVTFNECQRNIEKCTKRGVGLVKSTEKYGHFVGDNLASQISSIEKSVIEKIRKELEKNHQILFKYLLYNPDLCPPREKIKKLMDWYTSTEEVIIAKIPPNIHGISPLIIPGDHIIWHQKIEHRFNIQSNDNLALPNHNLVHFLESYWNTYLLFKKYCPTKHFLKTKLLSEILPQNIEKRSVDIEQFLNIMKQEFPNGFILKNHWDYDEFSSEISHATDLFKVFGTRKTGSEVEFNSDSRIISKKLSKCYTDFEKLSPTEDVDEEEMRNLLTNADHVFVQEFVPSKNTFIVNCINGLCPTDKIADEILLSDDEKNALDEFVIDSVNALPRKLRTMTFNFEIISLQGKKLDLKFSKIFVGGNNWKLHYAADIAYKHHNLLFKVVTRNKRSFASMTDSQSINFIKKFIKTQKIDLKATSPQLKYFLNDRIIDSNHEIHEVDLSKIDNVMNFKSKKLNSIKTAIQFLEQNHTMFIDDLYPWNYVNIIKHLAVSKRRLKQFHLPIENLLKLIRQESFRKKIIRSYIKEMDDFIEDLPYDLEEKSNFDSLKLKSEDIKNLIAITFHKLDELIDLMVLNIDHTELSEKIAKFFRLLFKQELTNWNRLIIRNIDVLDVKKFKMHFERTKRDNSPLFNEMVKSLKEAFYFFRALSRTGFSFPSFDFSIFSRIWIPQIRELYYFFMKSPNLIQKPSYKRLFISVCQLVNQIILETSDDSLFRLRKDYYKHEYEFLKYAGFFAKKQEEIGLLAEIIQSLIVLGAKEDEKMRYFLKDAQNLIIEKQSIDGFWFDEIGINIEKINQALRGLISETPNEFNDHFGKLNHQNRFSKKLQNEGLWRKNEKFDFPNYSKISKIVEKSIDERMKNDINHQYSEEIKVFGSQIIPMEIQKEIWKKIK